METTTTSTYETTPQTQPSAWSIGLKGGLYTGLVLVIFSLLGYILDWQSDPWYTNLTLVLSLIIGIYLTHKAFKEQGNGLMSYGQGLGIGTVVGLISGMLSAIFSIIYISFVDNSFVTNTLEKLRYQYEEQGLSDAQIEQALSWTEMVMSPVGMFISAVIGCIIYCFFFSLIISAFTKENDPSVEF